MVATFSWVEYNANATDTIVATNLNLGSAITAHISPSTDPITAGTYSYSKWVRGQWTGTFTRIENLQFWMSSSGSGYVGAEKLNYSGTTGTYDGTTTYDTPTTNLDAAGGTLKAIIVADPGAANIGFTGSLTASLTNSDAGANECDFIVVQASIGAGAAAGATQTKQFRLQYDEV